MHRHSLCEGLRKIGDRARAELQRFYRIAHRAPQTLAIQGPRMIGSVWPDWVILLYIIGVELTVE
jgi:hypothetical protein